MTAFLLAIQARNEGLQNGIAPAVGLRSNRLRALFAALIALLLVGLQSGCNGERSEQAYPARKINLIVPFGPGGGTDTYARIFKQAIEQEDLLPVPLVVINQGGAGGTIGSRRVKEAEPDGYTIMVLHDAILTAKIAGQVDYGHEAFEPIAATSEVGMVIAVRDDAPFRSLDDLMQAARQTPDKIRFGANRGALTHFAGLQLEALAPGAEFRYAQIGGGAERFANLKAGHIDVTGFSIEEFVRFRSDQLRGLCFFGEKRHAAAPDVPTAIEQDYALVSRNTFYWWFPPGVPRDRVRYMEDVLRKAVASPHVAEKLNEIHCQPIFLKGRPLYQRLAASEAEFARVNAGVDNPIPWLPQFWLLAACLCAAASIADAIRLWWVSTQVEGTPPKKLDANDVLEPGRYGLAAAMLLCVSAYVILLSKGLDFRLSTVIFVSLAVAMLSRASLRAWLCAIVFAVVVAFGVYHLFTDFFVIDLPAG